MKARRKHPSYVYTLLQTILFSMFGSSIAFCQNTPVPPPDKQPLTLDCKQQTLAQIVATLSGQMKRSIVVDDEPSDRKVDIHTTKTAKEAVEAVAAAFDYAWTLNKHGVLVMRKAFTQKDTLPQMNLPEMRQTAKSIVDVLSALQCDPDHTTWGIQFQTLAQSFTDAQREQLRAGKILRLADLNQQQGSLLQQIVINHAFSYLLDGWSPLIQVLDSLPASVFVLRKSGPMPGIAPGKPDQPSGVALEQIVRDAENKEIHFKVAFVPGEKKP